jgi:hypothetical protein
MTEHDQRMSNHLCRPGTIADRLGTRQHWLSVLPLAGGLAFATEEVALRLGEAWGGLLNATFGYVSPFTWSSAD